MTSPSPATPGPSPSPDGGDPPREDHWLGRHPLADEHAVLLQEVTLRERAARRALGRGRWPRREIDALVAYLRYEVLDQATAEESLLFPHAAEGSADPRVRDLVRDHVRLREVTDELARFAVSDGRELGELVELLDVLEEFLDHHMRMEQAVLSPVTPEGTEVRRHPFRCHLWFPLTEGPDIDLDALPRAFAHRAALERFTRLRPGERVLVRSGCELESLWTALTVGHPGEFGWAYLEEGPEHWRAEVTRRPPG